MERTSKLVTVVLQVPPNFSAKGVEVVLRDSIKAEFAEEMKVVQVKECECQ